jgi:hypothetical protein
MMMIFELLYGEYLKRSWPLTAKNPPVKIDVANGATQRWYYSQQQGLYPHLQQEPGSMPRPRMTTRSMESKPTLQRKIQRTTAASGVIAKKHSKDFSF